MSEEERMALADQKKAEEAKKAEEEAKKGTEKKVESPTIEEIAQKIGWNPEFEGEGAVDAQTFIVNSRDINASLSKKVKNMNSEMEEMRKSLQIIAETNKVNSEAELHDIQSKIEDLKKQREVAVAESDQDAFKKAESDIEKLEKKAEIKSKVPENQSVNSDYISWVPDNPWYESNPVMRQWADQYATNNPDFNGMPTKKVLEIVGKKAREYYPEAFEGEKKATPAKEEKKETKAPVKKVADPARGGTGKKAYTFDMLSYNQKKVAEQFVSQLKGTKSEMTLDQYAEKYFKRFPEEAK